MTKAAVEAGIRELQEKQRNDPERYLVDQYATKIRKYFSISSSSSIDSSMKREGSEDDGEVQKLKKR